MILQGTGENAGQYTVAEVETMPGVYVASVLDAQKSNAYFALYEWNGKGFDEKKQTCVMDFEEVAKYCSTLDKPVVFVGDIAQKKADIIAQYENVSLGLPHLCMPRASNVAMAAISWI